MHPVREPARTPVARTYLLLIPYQSESVELQRQAERGVNGFQLGAADVATSACLIASDTVEPSAVNSANARAARSSVLKFTTAI